MRLVTLFCLLLAPACAEEYVAEVVRILDGDTIEVLRDKRPVRVRLNGIDAPEKGQPYSNAARNFLGQLCFRRSVTVRVTDTDRYGRTVADILLRDDRVANWEMVKAGLAWWFRRYAPRDKNLRDLEEEAREAKRGLWAEPNPVAPWVWRQK